MTGTVSWEALLWVIGVGGGAGSAVAVFLFWVFRLVQSLRKNWADDLQSRDARIDELEAAVTRNEAEHNEYRVHVAEKFATKDGVTAAIGRMEAAVEKLTSQVHDAVERLTTRLDRILERSNDAPRG